ncbi:MAG: hypothetical protein ACP6IY_22500 [Promethearchaeia archaeon]
MLEMIFHCPRCKSTNIIDLNDEIACPNCHLTFRKKDLEQFDDDDILSIEELDEIARELKKSKKSNNMN